MFDFVNDSKKHVNINQMISVIQTLIALTQ